MQDVVIKTVCEKQLVNSRLMCEDERITCLIIIPAFCHFTTRELHAETHIDTHTHTPCETHQRDVICAAVAVKTFNHMQESILQQ